jgi:hypothetical protein
MFTVKSRTPRAPLSFIAAFLVAGTLAAFSPEAGRAGVAPTLVQLEAAEFRVSENAGFVTITARRTGDLNQITHVEMITRNGTATPNLDYEPLENEVRGFDFGQELLEFHVIILPDQRIEPDETFIVELRNPRGFDETGPRPVGLGQPSQAVVVIEDDRDLSRPRAIHWTFDRNSVRLRWSDDSENEDFFEVHRRIGDGPWRQVARRPRNTTNYSEGGLRQGVVHRYRVRAVHAEFGPTLFSPVATFTIGRTPEPFEFALRLSRRRINFGTIPAGRQRTMTLRVTNVGRRDGVFEVGGLRAPFRVIGAQRFRLARRQSRNIRVRFEPTAPGQFQQTLAIRSVQAGHTAGMIPVVGRATAP